MRRTFKMRIPRNTNILINGSIMDVDISHNEFLAEFTKWTESMGWSFMGATTEVTEEEAAENLLRFIEEQKANEEE
ncbi:hypothetical protein MUG87_00070 [Ectobacillus sp. JY-23]|uniref:hypothetical protein n=1 Tax=Ectobacillus sp. JY-23 TaxID=2933872 RepID=UPI001FF6A2BB|nr:hypothetical protein [Ectobacillus sp. JY-23]UOY92588.1 hypothetical protein MUG87_00070 [Ectobacillus sp. JY-23]